MTVTTGVPAGVTIAASANPFYPGSSVTFSATPFNGGAAPSFQWNVNGINAGANSITYSYNPVNGDSVRCIMTSTLSCVTGNPSSSQKIIMNGSLAPSVTFTSCFDTITTTSAKPIRLKGGIPLGGTYSGFNALLTGAGHLNIQWDYTGLGAFFRSSTSHGPFKTWAHAINDFDPSVALYPSFWTNAFSVRCLKDLRMSIS